MSKPETVVQQAEKTAKQAEQAGETKLQDLVEEDVDSTDTNIRYAGYLRRVRSVSDHPYRGTSGLGGGQEERFDADGSGISPGQDLVTLRTPGSIFDAVADAVASDIGEAFRPVVPPYLVTAAYGVSWAYLIGDVAFTTYKAREFGPSPLEAANMSEPTRLSLVAVKRSVFQGIASMALPAFTIHTAVKQASKALRNSQNVQLKRWGPTAVGLGIVPALPFLFDHPVEKAVDVAFEKVEEQWFRHKHPSLPVPSAEPPVSKRDL